jgi:hypothetical protein
MAALPPGNQVRPKGYQPKCIIEIEYVVVKFSIFLQVAYNKGVTINKGHKDGGLHPCCLASGILEAEPLCCRGGIARGGRISKSEESLEAARNPTRLIVQEGLQSSYNMASSRNNQ